MGRKKLHWQVMLWAYIDEAGDRSHSARSSSHFLLSAVVMDAAGRVAADSFLPGLKQSIGRQPHQVLHWRNIKKHSQRLHVAQELGKQGFLTVSSVLVCKRQFPPGVKILDEDTAYLYTFRFLLERLSWLARDSGNLLDYTLAHIVRFKLSTLRRYEAALRAMPGCQVEWGVIPRGGHISTPRDRVELQLADLAASATYKAFEPDQYGNTEQRYLRAFASRLYRRGSATNSLTSYGLKLHPGSALSLPAYSWVATL